MGAEHCIGRLTHAEAHHRLAQLDHGLLHIHAEPVEQKERPQRTGDTGNQNHGHTGRHGSVGDHDQQQHHDPGQRRADRQRQRCSEPHTDGALVRGMRTRR